MSDIQLMILYFLFIFFFKQKTAYEMRISDWSSDVCSSDLMKIVYFTHSLQSCWNHGNAHFLRGVLSDLIARGHEVSAWEPRNGWSLDNLIHDQDRKSVV